MPRPVKDDGSLLPDLIAGLSRYAPVSDALAKALIQSSVVQRFAPGTVLQHPEDPALQSYFVLKGCVRSYILGEKDETTLDFYLEDDPILPLGYGTGAASGHWLECTEPTLALVGTLDQEEAMVTAYPELKTLCLVLAEVLAAKLQDQQVRFRTQSPEERYRDLVQRRPGLVQRVPQYQIASLLGIRPESLSRIRRRIASRS